MKIVHVVEAWKGGIASYVEILIRDQLARGHEVHVLADAEQFSADDRDLGVSIVHYRSSRKPWLFPQISADIARKIEQLGVDVVHCHSTFPGLYVRLRRHLARVIYTPHSWSFFKQDVGGFVKYAYKLVERALAKKCDGIVCMSMEEITAAIGAGVPADKLHLIYSGIPDLEQMSLPEAPAEGPLKVGFFGRFDYQKGFDLLERAAPLLADNIELHLFGGAVRGAVSTSHPRFENHGWIDHKRIPEQMAAMDIILIPSRWEGFALTPLEAMRVGRPLIISNRSSLPEAVIHGFNGLVLADYSPAKLAEILEKLTRSECRRMGENARVVFGQAFRFDVFLDKMDAVYRP